ncbi:MAG: flippase-like domain-containing protein [Candidatus Sabulitectum sp.]|nr:flippase-like domain-containing protein [Candidatus Sabulitectum sp.]
MNSTRSGNTGKTVMHLVSALAGIALLVLIASRAGYEQFLQNLRKVQPIVLVPLVTVYSISWLLRGLRFKRILALLNAKSSLFKALGIELTADLANQVIPAKLGDSVKILYMRKTGMLNYTSGTFATFLVRAMDLAAVIILALFSVVFVSGSVAAGYLSYIVTMSVLVVLLVLTGWLFVFHPSVFRKMLIGPLRKLRPSIAELADQLKQNPGQLTLILLESMLVWVFDILTLFVFLLVFGVKLSFAETAFVMLLSTVTKILPLTPNGLGVYEGMMVVLLTGFGVSESTAFTIAVLDHGFMNIYSMLLSLIALYSMGLNLRGMKQLTGTKQK